MANNQIATNTTIGGGNNRIVLKYQGFEQTKTSENLNTQVTYQSTRAGIDHAISAVNQWKIGTVDDLWGRLDSIDSQPGDGPFWNAVLNYNKPLSAGIIITTGNDDKATQNSLTVRMLSLPIQSHPNYKYIWNHSLASNYGSNQIDYADISGLNAQQAADFAASHSGRVKWIQSDSELPSEPLVEENVGSDDVFTYYWKINYTMEKPGVTCYDFPTYSVTQNAKHTSRQKAAWSLAVKNGKLKFPTYGDFGLQSKFYPNDSSANPPKYHWLCLGAGVNFDGKYWIASCTYQWSPDPNGWDQDLYEVAAGSYDKNNNNPILS